MSAFTIAAFLLGVLVTMLFLGRTNRRTFQENIQREFSSIFLDSSGLPTVSQVLHKRAEALRVAYIALDTFQSHRGEQRFVRSTPSDNIYNKVVTERDLQNAVTDAHWSFDRAAGLAYLMGWGKTVDRVKKQFARE